MLNNDLPSENPTASSSIAAIDNAEIHHNRMVGIRTPILFSTDNGICLRTTSSSTSGPVTNQSENIVNSKASPSSKYRFQFCDLERWQQHGAKVNTIGLSPDAPMNWNIKSKLIVKRHKSVRFVAEAERSPNNNMPGFGNS